MTRKTSHCSVKHNTRKISRSGIKYLQASSLPGWVTLRILPDSWIPCLLPLHNAPGTTPGLLALPQAPPLLPCSNFIPVAIINTLAKTNWGGNFFQMTILSCRPSNRNFRHLMASYPQWRAKRCANMLTCTSACFLHSYLLGPLPRE